MGRKVEGERKKAGNEEVLVCVCVCRPKWAGGRKPGGIAIILSAGEPKLPCGHR